jgi:hypothetical protein
MIDKPAPDAQLAKVTLGVPGVAGAEIPIPRSAFSWIKALFKRRPEAELFAVASMRARVFASADDEGTLDIYLSALNMSSYEVRVEQLFLERVAASGSDLSMMAPMFTPPKSPIAGHSIREVYFRVPLTAPAIRLLLRVVQKAQNPCSTPRIELTVTGSLDLTAKKTRIRVPFMVTCQPELNFQCPGANA